MNKVLDVYEVQLFEFKYLAGDFVSLGRPQPHFPCTVYFIATPYASVLDSYPKVEQSRSLIVFQLPKY